MRVSLSNIAKRGGLGRIVMGAATVAGGLIADAQEYPPNAPAVSVDDPTPDPSGPVVVTVTDCIPGETVNFALLSSTDTDTCVAGTGASFFVQAATGGGVAVGDLDAPGAPGSYTGTASLVESEAILPFDIVVQAATGAPSTPTTIAPVLPRTGSDSNGLTNVAIGLVLAGGALFGVSQLRRRRLPA